jgi:hypothetical protein
VSQAIPFRLKINARKVMSRTATSNRKLNRERVIRAGGGIVSTTTLIAGAMKSAARAGNISL